MHVSRVPLANAAIAPSVLPANGGLDEMTLPDPRAVPAGPSQAVINTTNAVAAGLAAIAAARTATSVFHTVCALALRLPGVSGVAIVRPDGRGLLGVAYSPTVAPLAGAPLAIASTALQQRWISARTPGASAGELAPFSVPENADLLVVPFVRDDELLGALVIAGKDGRAPAASKAERITAGAIGIAAAQALDAVALRHRLEWSVPRREHQAALVEERKRISRELHDGPTQELAIAGIAIERLISRLGSDDEGRANAHQARDLIDQAIHGMRRILTALRRTGTEKLSVTGPLRELIAELAPEPDAPELAVDFSQVSGVSVPPEVERALIGIVREALHNVRKHANADSVQVEVRRGGHEVEVAVVDDGVGFDGMSEAGHFGLEQIRELAEGSGGRVEVASLPGIGTSVRAWIPLPGSPTEQTGELTWLETLDWAEDLPPRVLTS